MGKLEKIMQIKDKDEREIKLREYAKSLGCSLYASYTSNGIHLEHEIVRRIREAEASQRQHKLWMIALISAIASFLSALAAWIAVLK